LRADQLKVDCLGPELPPIEAIEGLGLSLLGLTSIYRVGIVRRLEHGAFLVLACGGALLIEPDAE